jgi:Zn-dependent peptidase ImmA (M78 family)/DNA-binding XRE family transcriptional regulator
MFNPQRLEIARKRRSLTAKKLAEDSGITAVTISRIMKGENEPEFQTIEAIAKALEYPTDFFFQDDLDTIETEAASFRSLKAITAKECNSALSASSLAFGLNDWISEKFNLPSMDLPDLSDLASDPATAATLLRRSWGLGNRPVGNLVRLLESKGVRFFSLFENTKNVDAFCCWRKETPFIFLNTLKSAERSRFDTAHELAHLVLHRKSGSKHTEAENEADQFASEFLMPSSDIFSNLPKFISLETLIASKKRWRVSVMALANRSHKLGIISDWQYRTLCIQASKNGYRKTEPSPIQPEFSGLFEKVFKSLWSDGYTVDRIANELGLPFDELHHLVNGLMPNDASPQKGIANRPKLVVV